MNSRESMRKFFARCTSGTPGSSFQARRHARYVEGTNVSQAGLAGQKPRHEAREWKLPESLWFDLFETGKIMKNPWFSMLKRLDRMEKLHGSIRERLERLEKQPPAELPIGESLFLSDFTWFLQFIQAQIDVCQAKVRTRTWSKRKRNRGSLSSGIIECISGVFSLLRTMTKLEKNTK